MIKVFFDTNVFFSAFYKPSGSAGKLMELAIAERFELYLSPDILDELEDVLSRHGKNGKAQTSADDFIKALGSFFPILMDFPILELVPNDPRDNHIVSAAIAGGMDYLVSGDKKHILPLAEKPTIQKAQLQVLSLKEFIIELNRLSVN